MLWFYMAKQDLQIEGKLNSVLVKENLNTYINSGRTGVSSLKEQTQYYKYLFSLFCFLEISQ